MTQPIPSPTPAAKWPDARVRRLRRAAIVLAALATAWTIGVGWWLPRFVQPRLEAEASAALGAPLILERLEVSPWTLRVRATGLRLGPTATPWLTVAGIDAEWSAETLWRLAPVLERLHVRAPRIELERIDTERLNISPMLDALARRPPAPADREPLRFALHNISVDEGEIHVLDRVAGVEHRVSDLRLGIPFLSNLPSKVAIDVRPLIDARIDGGRVHVEGSTLPFTEGLRSVVDLRWQGIDVPAAVKAVTPWLPRTWPVPALRQGRLDLALNLVFERRAAPAGPLLQIGGRATLSGLRADVTGVGTQLGWEQLSVEGLDLRPLERRATVARVTLQAPAIEVDLPRWRAAVAKAPTAGATVGQDEPAPGAWQWRVEQVTLAAGRARLSDPAWPKGRELAPIDGKFMGLSSHEAAPASVELTLAEPQGLRAGLVGQVGLASRRAVLDLQAEGIDADAWAAPWRSALPVRLLDGTLALKAQVDVGDEGWSIRDGSLEAARLQVRPPESRAAGDGNGDRLTVARLLASGVAVDARAGQPLAATLQTVRIERLDLNASRGAFGVLPWWRRPGGAGDPPTIAAASGSATPDARWQVDDLRCSGCSATLVDRALETAPTLTLTRAELRLQRLSSDLARPFETELSAGVGRDGRARLQGTVQLQPLAVRSRIDLTRVDLSLLGAYLQPYVNFSLESGHGGAAGELRVQGTAQQTVNAVQWQGRLSLGGLRTLDRVHGDEFVRLKTLDLEGADIRWQPTGVEADLGSVALDGFSGRIILNADGRLNLRDALRRPGDGEGVSLTTPAAAAATAPVAAAPASPTATPAMGGATALRWNAIRLTDGAVDFTDNFIRPNYSAQLTGINGEISALAWNDPRPAQVRLAGKVDDSAPFQIDGTIHPLGVRLHTDLRAEARGIDLTRASTYSARYAGYGIEKGTLTARVRYRIDGGRLEADNELRLDQLTFGDQVDSPDALKLPVLLAVSLLKDRNGVIDLDLPIGGSLDDPQFSVGRIIVQVIVNLIEKAVTAPFHLLAQAFGGGKQELSYVVFEPGSSAIDETAQAALDTLAKALVDRPGLRLEITGRADPVEDAAALRRAHVERQLRMAKAQATKEPLEQVRVAPDERARWLQALWRGQQGSGMRALAARLREAPPAPEIEAQLLREAPAGADPLKALADARAGHVKAHLAAQVAPERLLTTASRLDAEGITDAGKASRVVFALK